MTREETLKILMTIQVAFPNYRVQDKQTTLNVWATMLHDYSYNQVAAALKTYITTDTSGFAPSIGQLIEKVRFINSADELSEMEAWALVSRALRNGYYGAEAEFEKLPSAVQKSVGSPSMLRQWACTDIESVENVIQSNFMRTYRSVVAEEKIKEKIPDDIKKLIGRDPEKPALKIYEKEDEEKTAGIPMPERLKQQIRRVLC